MDVDSRGTNLSIARTFIDDVDMPEPQESMGEKVFFELLMLAPIKINLSFTRTERGEGDETRRGRSVLSLALDVLTTTVGNVHDAALQLNVSNIASSV